MAHRFTCSRGIIVGKWIIKKSLEKFEQAKPQYQSACDENILPWDANPLLTFATKYEDANGMTQRIRVKRAFILYTVSYLFVLYLSHTARSRGVNGEGVAWKGARVRVSARGPGPGQVK